MKPENRFIAKLHKVLQRSSQRIFAEKTNNPYRRGIPDVYYEGGKDCLWVEYKYVSRAAGVLHPRKLLSALQQMWLKRAVSNNRRCAVIVGCPTGVAVFPGTSWDCDSITPHWSPLQEAIGFIQLQVEDETRKLKQERRNQ